MRFFFAFSLLLAICVAAQQTQSVPSGGPALSAQRKFDHIRENGARRTPDRTPTIITESELNAWLASGRAQLPQGVKKLQVHGEPGVINGTAVVDFDEVTNGRYSGNPFMSMFRGSHEVEAKAHAQGSGGQGHVHIDSVALDGVEVPEMMLEYFVEKYVTPKHPGIGIDSTFALPNRIDTATVGSGQVTIVQK
jgi:hypothetical protein